MKVEVNKYFLFSKRRKEMRMNINKNYIFVVSLFFQISMFSNLNCAYQTFNEMVIISPVSDLKASPEDESGLVTQLLYGEKVKILGARSDGWLRVQHSETPKSVKEGYIRQEHASDVQRAPQNNIVIKSLWAPVYSEPDKDGMVLFNACMGTKFCGQKKNNYWYQVHLLNRENKGVGYIYIDDVNLLSAKPIVSRFRLNLEETAKLFLGVLYYCGGRSVSTGVDLSSFISLVYGANGFDITSDVQNQFESSKNVFWGKDLSCGDLIFLANPKKPDKVTHVLMYLGDGKVIECVESCGVIMTLVKDRFGVSVGEIFHACKCGENTLYLGKLVG